MPQTQNTDYGSSSNNNNNSSGNNSNSNNSNSNSNTSSNSNNNNSMGVAVAPPGQYSGSAAHIPLLNAAVPSQSLMAALHMNQHQAAGGQHHAHPHSLPHPHQQQQHQHHHQQQQAAAAAAAAAYMASPGLAAIGYISYPNAANGYVQSPNLLYQPHNLMPGPMDMVPAAAAGAVPTSLGHPLAPAGPAGGPHHNHKMTAYDTVAHFGSLSSNQIRKSKNSIMSKTNLYINGLQESATDESVRALVDGIIEPKSCKAMMSHGKCRGSGFIDCATEVDAEKVIQILKNKLMPDGSRLAVKFAYENEKDDLNVYVRNLPRQSSFTNSDLEDLFKEYGQVVSVKLLQSDNQYTGTGFVRYSTAEEAQRAVDLMNGKKLVVGSDEKPVICKLADKGGRRTAHGGQSISDGLQHSSDGDIQHHSNGVLSAHSVAGDVVDKINSGYSGLQVISGQPYGTQPGGTTWLPAGHASPDILAQEIQNINLAGPSYATLVPGLLQPAPLPVSAFADDSAVQQQMLALLWNQQQSSRMMAAANYQPPQTVQSHHHHHQQQQQQTQTQPQQAQQPQPQSQQSMIHWQQHHHQAPTNSGGLYYTTTDQITPFPHQLIYQHHQYSSRPPRSVIPATINTNMKSQQLQPQQQQQPQLQPQQQQSQPQQQPSLIMDQAAVLNGQSPPNLSTNQCVVNGNGNMDSHQANKM